MTTNDKTTTEAQLAAQSVLKDVVLDKLTELEELAKNEKDQNINAELRRKQDRLAEQFGKLQLETVQIIAANTRGDIETINKVSADVTAFKNKIEGIKKKIQIAAAIIVFVGAALAEDPKTIANAAIELYKVLNDDGDTTGSDLAMKAMALGMLRLRIPSNLTEPVTIKTIRKRRKATK